MNNELLRNILIVRTDRIGDIVLTLPMVSVVVKRYPSAKISMLVRSYTRELVDGYPGIQEVLSYDQEGEAKSLRLLVKELRSRHFDAVILAYPTARLAALMFLSNIPVRVGTGYRWYSFLFNRRVFEHRKTAEKHELEYNLSLLAALGCEIPHKVKPFLPRTAEAMAEARGLRERLSISEHDSLVVLHPGSGGSAREWSTTNFTALARQLANEGMSVVVTGGAGEEELVTSVVNEAGSGVRSLVNALSLKELPAFLSLANLFVSNSTGPLHIAAAVGTPVIGFYPPILACSPQRWGPYTEEKVVFVPDPLECSRCQGRACQGNECMDLIRVEDVVAEARRLLKYSARRNPEQERV